MNFYEKVWEECKKVPEGKVTTYGQIAKKLRTKAYQAVGTAMNKNPYSLIAVKRGYVSISEMVPCHRVINSNGRIGDFAFGTEEKIKMLKKEGVVVVDGKIDLKKYGV